MNPIQEMMYPELTRFPARNDAKAALRRSTVELGVCLLVLLVLLPILMCYAAAKGFPNWFTRYGPIASGMFVGGIAVGLLFVAHYTLRSRTRRKLRIELRKFGIRLCFNCGYDLRAATGETCSECGAIDRSAVGETRTKGDLQGD